MLSPVACCLMTACCVAAPDAGGNAAAPAAEAVDSEAAYQRLLLAGDWRERAAAVEQLRECGEEALPFLIQGTKHGWDAIQEACYQLLFEKFPDREETSQAVVRGLACTSPKVRYMCAYFAGPQEIVAAEPALRKIYDTRSHDQRLTAAKSLAELGHSDVIRVLYDEASSDWYMPRAQANNGLKALARRDLNDFGDYDWSEGAFVSGGVEIRRVHLRPIEDAEMRARRYHALAEFCRWLKQERPDLDHVLDPNDE